MGHNNHFTRHYCWPCGFQSEFACPIYFVNFAYVLSEVTGTCVGGGGRGWEEILDRMPCWSQPGFHPSLTHDPSFDS